MGSNYTNDTFEIGGNRDFINKDHTECSTINMCIFGVSFPGV